MYLLMDMRSVGANEFDKGNYLEFSYDKHGSFKNNKFYREKIEDPFLDKVLENRAFNVLITDSENLYRNYTTVSMCDSSKILNLCKGVRGKAVIVKASMYIWKFLSMIDDSDITDVTSKRDEIVRLCNNSTRLGAANGAECVLTSQPISGDTNSCSVVIVGDWCLKCLNPAYKMFWSTVDGSSAPAPNDYVDLVDLLRIVLMPFINPINSCRVNSVYICSRNSKSEFYRFAVNYNILYYLSKLNFYTSLEDGSYWRQ